MSHQSTKPQKNRIDDLRMAQALAEHGRNSEAVLPVLQELQAANRGYLDHDILAAVAAALRMSEAQVYSVASFYSLLSTRPRHEKIIRVCDGPACVLRGAETMRASINSAAAGGEWTVERCSCPGLCDRAPAALVNGEPCGPITSDRINALLTGWRGATPSYTVARAGETRVVMGRIGLLDPGSIDSALDAGAYEVLLAALYSDPVAILDTVDQSGLRGCGGAGFPTGRKWRMVAEIDRIPKTIICNADESEPGAFKDRVLMEGDPHLLLEGMALAGYAVGASAGVIYIRGEYEWVAQGLEDAIAQAQELSWLGANIQGSDFSFHVQVHRGAGAYICGEETALLNSLEGRRGEPRLRPPYPTSRGYKNTPTLINNVETFCHVPAIISRGPQWFRSLGTPDSPGTKLFTVTGCIQCPGVFEAPLGITLRHVIELGGGLLPGSRFKAALTGGAAGSFVPASMLDMPIDYSSGKRGPMLGSGPMLILDESVSIPRLLSSIAYFFEMESCGKCTPCREGTREARKQIEAMSRGRGHPGGAARLRDFARQMNLTSLCGLGQSVAWPVQSALHHFEGEFVRLSEA